MQNGSKVNLAYTDSIFDIAGEFYVFIYVYACLCAHVFAYYTLKDDFLDLS